MGVVSRCHMDARAELDSFARRKQALFWSYLTLIPLGLYFDSVLFVRRTPFFPEVLWSVENLQESFREHVQSVITLCSHIGMFTLCQNLPKNPDDDLDFVATALKKHWYTRQEEDNVRYEIQDTRPPIAWLADHIEYDRFQYVLDRNVRLILYTVENGLV